MIRRTMCRDEFARISAIEMERLVFWTFLEFSIQQLSNVTSFSRMEVYPVVVWVTFYSWSNLPLMKH